MPPINKDFINILLQNDKINTKYTCFVETGTCTGETILTVEPLFEELHTIEIKKEFHETAKNYYNGNKINFILGDTSVELSKIIKNIDKNTIFFLDAHWSGGITGRGDKICPLIEEISDINKLFKHSAIIIIDDFRDFESEHWKDINKNRILSLLENRIVNTYHLPSQHHPLDRFIIQIKEINDTTTQYCNNCSNNALFNCPCFKAKYCSKNCQQKDRLFHKNICTYI